MLIRVAFLNMFPCIPVHVWPRNIKDYVMNTYIPTIMPTLEKDAGQKVSELKKGFFREPH